MSVKLFSNVILYLKSECDALFASVTHASTHASAQSDAIKIDDLAAGDDNTDLDASTSKHGLCPKFTNEAGKYLSAAGTFTTPAGGTSADYLAAQIFS
jgi:hypothetical protein